jgi:DNA repair exonuclease SbcCD ATPase subunit
MSNVKITALEIENLKRVKAVAITVGGKALTVIGGKNAQGKTSILDAIMWALGGDRFKPTKPVREGAEEAYIKVELDNGVTVERGGVNGVLKVTSSKGKGGQTLLNEFVNQFALNLPRFMQASPTEKSKMLLDVFPGLGPKLVSLNAMAKSLFDERHTIGRIADQKAKYAAELPYNFEAPAEPLSGADMAQRLQEALAVNGRNQATRTSVKQAEETVKSMTYRVESAQQRIKDLEQSLNDARSELNRATVNQLHAVDQLNISRASVAQLVDQDTTSIQKELENIDSINAQIRMNESKRSAEDEANHLKAQYSHLSEELDKVRAQRIQLLASVEMPLAGLSLDDEGQLIYQGQPWDCMSGSEQLRVSTAICAAVNPKCGFVLLDKLEAMDTDTLAEFAQWLDERGLQAIGTRVGSGDECSVVIEDGEVVQQYKFD